MGGGGADARCRYGVIAEPPQQQGCVFIVALVPGEGGAAVRIYVVVYCGSSRESYAYVAHGCQAI